MNETFSWIRSKHESDFIVFPNGIWSLKKGAMTHLNGYNMNILFRIYVKMLTKRVFVIIKLVNMIRISYSKNFKIFNTFCLSK